MDKEDIKKKAQELVEELNADYYLVDGELLFREKDVKHAIIETAEWMQEQMIERSCEIFCEMRCPSEMHFHGKRRCGKDTCNKLEEFKQAINEEI